MTGWPTISRPWACRSSAWGPGAIEDGALERLDTLVIGIFAFRTRPDLAAAVGRIHAWVRAGGHLVTLYHRPWDGWDPEATPPAFLKIGQPSLRWRVTDQAAAVEVLLPDHPLLTRPKPDRPGRLGRLAEGARALLRRRMGRGLSAASEHGRSRRAAASGGRC